MIRSMVSFAFLALVVWSVSASAQVAPPAATDGDKPLSLAGAIELALKNSARVRLTEVSRAIAQSEMELARSALLPTLKLGHGMLIESENSRENRRANQQIPGAKLERDPFLTAYEITLEQVLYSGGHNTAKYRLNKDEIQRVEFQTIQEKGDLRFDVAQAYYRVLLARQLMDVHSEALKLAEEHLRTVEAKRGEGRATQLNVLAAKSQVAKAQADVRKVRDDTKLAEATLNSLMGVEIDRPVHVVEEGADQPMPLPKEEVLTRDPRERPKLLQLSTEVLQAQEAVQMALGGFYRPAVKLKSKYELRHEKVYPPPEQSFEVQLQLEFPLFKGGETKAQLSKAKALVEAAREKLKLASDENRLRVRQAYYEVRDARETVAATRAQIDQAEEGLRVASAGYQEGVTPNEAVLQAQTALKEARTGYARALYRYKVGLADLERLTGTPPLS